MECLPRTPLAALIVLLGTMRMRAAATRSQERVAPIVDGAAAARYGMDDFLQATATPLSFCPGEPGTPMLTAQVPSTVQPRA